MSMKIYTGVRFTTPHLLDIHNLFMEWRVEVGKLTRRDYAALAAAEAVDLIDKADRNSTDLPKNPLFTALCNIWDEEKKIKTTGHRNPRYDFDFSVSLLPFEGQVYGIVYTERSEWRGQFYEQPWVEEFGYWNNTDQPEGLTDEEWEERRRIWNAIFDQFPTPALCGLTAECTHNMAYPHVEDVMANLPTDEQRIKNIARIIVSSEKMKEGNDPAHTPQESMEQAMSAIWWVNSEEGQARLQEVAETITVRPITLELLRS